MNVQIEIRPSGSGQWFVRVGRGVRFARLHPTREKAIRYITRCVRILLAEKNDR